METKCRIYTDHFLTHTLHYALSGTWNEEDGHSWVFNASNIDAVKTDILASFARELDILFDDAIVEVQGEQTRCT